MNHASPRIPAKKISRSWWLFLAVWTPLALWAAWYIWHLQPGTPRVLESSTGNDSEAWWQLFHRNFHLTYPWIILAPFVLFVCLKFPLGIRPTLQAVPVLLLATAIFATASLALGDKLTQNLSPLVVIDAKVTASSIASFFVDLNYSAVHRQWRAPFTATVGVVG